MEEEDDYSLTVVTIRPLHHSRSYNYFMNFGSFFLFCLSYPKLDAKHAFSTQTLNPTKVIPALHSPLLPEQWFRHDDQSFEPECRMHEVQGFQVFPQFPINHVIAAFQPWKRRHVVTGRGSSTGRIVEVDQDVVIGDQLVQRRQHVPVLLCRMK